MNEPHRPPSPTARSGQRLRRLVLLVVLIGGMVVILISGLLSQLSWEQVNQQREQLRELVATHPLTAAGLFFLVEVVAVGLSLPVATVLSVSAGVLFGRWWGTLLVSFASTLGATLAFLSSRYLLGQTVRAWLPTSWLNRMDRGIERDGALFLFTLRLVPVVPFFAINLGMGLTQLRLRTFWWVSQLGMLPGTFVYVNAGAVAGQIEAPNDLLSWPVLAALGLLAVLPWLARWFVQRLRPADAGSVTAEQAPSPKQAEPHRQAESHRQAEPHQHVTGN